MLKTRVIPVLLIQNGGLVKTIQFGNETYIGDPINAVRIFNEKEVDELIIIDISATKQGKSPDLKKLENIASECFMPVCYGGGIHDLSTVKAVLKVGIEKISFNTAAFEQPDLIKHAAQLCGSQAIVASIDVKKDFWGKNKVFVRNGTKNTGWSPGEYGKKMESLGAGEILIQSIENDGIMQGYDISLLNEICENVSIPVIALGGAGNLNDLRKAKQNSSVSAVACGSMFVYHGKTKGILINYPSQKELAHFV